LTPEASIALDEYLKKRKTDGAYLNSESPLFRQDYSLGIAKSKPLSKTGYQAMMDRALRRCGLRTGYTKQRRDIQLDHGFRKRWNTIVKTTDNMKRILGRNKHGQYPIISYRKS
jgi:integrase/recombinase XerD